MRGIISWALAGFVGILIVMACYLPASYLSPFIDRYSMGKIALGDAEGTVWHGSAFIGSAPAENEPVTPLFPGRFSWHISPLLLLDTIKVDLSNPAALSSPVHIDGSWREITVSPGSLALPAARLASLGAPLNTIKPTGQMQLNWQTLNLFPGQDGISLTGHTNLEMHEMASRLSPIKPLGAYNLALTWHGRAASVMLTTLQGPMLLDGTGMLNDGHLSFSGTAKAEPGYEVELANLLNLLGQPSMVGGKEVIALTVN